MKLTILRLTALTPQDQIDLAKIWPDNNIAHLASTLNAHRQLYVARFNARLLGALILEVAEGRGSVSRLTVREITRRRGVGKYLLEETLAQNPSLESWVVNDDGSDAAAVRAAFMQACGFHLQAEGWVR